VFESVGLFVKPKRACAETYDMSHQPSVAAAAARADATLTRARRSLPGGRAAAPGRRHEQVAVVALLCINAAAVTAYGALNDHIEPWRWAMLHALYVVAAVLAALAAWRMQRHLCAEVGEARARLERAAGTDGLTGLANRRGLMADLAAMHSRLEPRVLVLLDLDGFKDYNDTFGHAAGDSLLERLGSRLRASVGTAGAVYRLDGDEFCVLWRAGPDGRAGAEARAAAALREHGEGFAISAAHSAVAMPAEASSGEEALRLADLRMHSSREASRPSSGTQTRDVLLQTLAEIRPDLETHVDAVMVLAEAVATELDLPAPEIERVRFAAQLHDIGKVAIPEAILKNPGRLDEQEWSFISRHTIIGERILSAAPALAEVATLVRASHERWDGKGYPDHLRGEQIPIGARIISVCDSFDAMTSNRAYRLAMAPQDAVEELERCTGTQFDPLVVDAFVAALRPTLVAADGVVHDAAPPAKPRSATA